MKRKVAFLIVGLFLTASLCAQEYVKGEIRDVVSQGSYTPSFKSDGSDEAPLNVILMIGDGMGLAHLSTAMYANGGELTITNLKTCGWVRTQSATDFTTDSAASGTAYATGSKTHNGAIGVDVNDKPLKNLPEKLAKDGIISGVVTTDDMDGATPSSFFAHQPSRKMSDEIWADLPYSKLVFFAGGSKESFESLDYETQDALEKQFFITDVLDKRSLKAKRVGYLPPKSETASMSKGRGDFLPATTTAAIDFLESRSDDEKGFFLMVEGARIDKSSHDNDFPSMVKEVLDFDKAVEAAIRFAEKDGRTLVIISADHETGALSLRSGDPAEGKMKGAFSSGGHTAIPVPLFAYGPCSRNFMGVQENSDVSSKIEEILLNR
jgi:alkaline phosphatase